jgi:hypothetical protein
MASLQLTSAFQPGDLIRWDSVKNDHQADFDIDTGIVIDVNDNLMTSPKVLILWEDGETTWMGTKCLRLISTIS